MEKKKRTLINISFLFCLLLQVLFTGCKDKKDDPVVDGPAQPGVEDSAQASRTVLVYMVADNSLGSGGYDKEDLNEMKQAAKEGQLGKGRLLVYHAPRNKTPMLKEVTPEGIDTLKIYESDAVSVSIAQMEQVISDAKECAPADDYGLVLWSHALGWLQDGIAENRGIAYSFGLETGGKKMNITALRDALTDKEFSFVYFDCCFMGSVEVMYELRKTTPWIVASPAEDPINGMPYQLTLKYLFMEKPDLVAAAKTTFDYYMANYAKDDCPVTLSVVNTAALDELAAATREIYQEAEALMPEGYDPQKLAEEYMCYYYDLADYVKVMSKTDVALSNWQKALDKAVAYKDNSPWIWGTVPLTRYCGLSTYIMSKAYHASTKGYNQLSWYKDVASVLIENMEEN